ncbi:MAG: DUF3862 domain-containing protein [Mesorhizobium sp.]|uniref:DUF3862 domain-containing protein n=1 Tax=Mesorhizobium sp. TaxID=1871066 RepID=UPI000FE8C733|nr:DUF3862 domain-containing protein [Mesorhizobium sp.]RWD28937.1 MAG: DUF3862 domain-containing protein [Mesorhizobium sp.]RWD77684.1 MAG: DUF3862 domain-containing protein [Mesorhizobium sp.]TIS37898.1 MAG: DUF3862 domain-containing protein [Mesorhizobium sp.]TIX74262.1 MAG: DUF3862 domain-containing protein [Mesorhizobium sp.]TIX88232.1 MAG: DUF3862 domain-containing protein [Mesorhizobium sp.]
MCDEPAWFGHCARGHCLSPAVASDCSVTKSQYNALRNGMSYQHAIRILGCEGEELSSSEFGGYETVMYMWDGNGFGGNMHAMFQNGAMVSKAQFGLK